jgi:hypothetical protein
MFYYTMVSRCVVLRLSPRGQRRVPTYFVNQNLHTPSRHARDTVPSRLWAFVPDNLPATFLMNMSIMVEQEPYRGEEASNGRVTIRRHTAEGLLVDAYRDTLSRMSDQDLSRLFETEILKDFPEDSILLKSSSGSVSGSGLLEAKRKDAVGEPTTSPEMLLQSSENETPSLPPQQKRAEEGDEQGSTPGKPIVDENLISRLLANVQDPKDIAVPVMGTGVLVLGVAAMYKLISSLSNVGDKDAQKIDDGEGGLPGTAVKQGLPPPAEDPYTMYEQTSQPGGIIWQRREETSATGVDAQEDPWRVPLDGSGNNDESRAVDRWDSNDVDPERDLDTQNVSTQGDASQSTSSNNAKSNERNTRHESKNKINKNNSKKKKMMMAMNNDVLDNAESITSNFPPRRP